MEKTYPRENKSSLHRHRHGVGETIKKSSLSGNKPCARPKLDGD